MLAGIVRDGLVTARLGTVNASGRIVEVTRIKITAAGRGAIKGLPE
jgi:hypothetical protein